MFVANVHLEAIEARTAAMERSDLELERFSREAAVALRNSRSAESRSLSGRDWKKILAQSDRFCSITFPIVSLEAAWKGKYLGECGGHRRRNFGFRLKRVSARTGWVTNGWDDLFFWCQENLWDEMIKSSRLFMKCCQTDLIFCGSKVICQVNFWKSLTLFLTDALDSLLLLLQVAALLVRWWMSRSRSSGSGSGGDKLDLNRQLPLLFLSPA